jgi:hypothetical protein
VVSGYAGDGTQRDRNFCIAEDLQALETKLRELRDVGAVVIDPITAYLGETDSHKNAEVRGLLMPLSELAARHNMAVIGVSHLTKAVGTQALMRVTGSLAFVAAARAAYLVAPDPEDKARRLFLPLKNNLGPDVSGLAYSIEAAIVDSSAGSIETSRVVWHPDPVLVTADDLTQSDTPKGTSALHEAMDWLQGVLADRALAAAEVLELARADGISEKTLRRAQKALGIQSVKIAMAQGWSWSLPKTANIPEDGRTRKLGTFGHNGHLQPSDTIKGKAALIALPS